MRRLTAALAAAVLALLGTVALAGGASAAPGDVTISAPGEGGEDCTPLVQGTADPATEVFVLINGSEADVSDMLSGGAFPRHGTSIRTGAPHPKARAASTACSISPSLMTLRIS